MDPDASTHMDHMTEDAPTASPEASIDMEMETDLETATFPPQPSSSPPLLPPMGAIGYVELEYGQNQHSLPNLEEARTEGAIAQGGSYNRYSGKNKRFAALVAIAVTTIALVVGFSVAFVQTHKGNSAASSSSINSSPPADPQDPSVATTRNVSRLEEVQAFLSVSITKDFANLTSPQYRALLWIADQDEAMVSVPQDPANYETSYAFVQRYVLAVFYFALDGPNWMHKMGFLSKQSECDWNFGLSATVPGFAQASFMYGVHCNARNAISSIFITGNNLKGQLPTEIGDLIELEHISLFKNQISGTLPSRMRSMVELNFLAIESNMLSGPLPTWINKLGKLQYLDLGDNALSGVLPSFKGMNVLEEVAFDGNHLSGNIDALNDATGLRLLYLGQNNFTGRIHDDTFPALTKLEILDIGDNKFTGYFPAHFYNLNELDMHNNSLTDHGLPTVNTKSSPMTFLSLYGSGIPGTIPSTLGQLSKLEHLDLSENKITGTMSTQFDTLTNLKSLYLSANNFTAGPIPDLWSCTQLQELSMAKTKRNGYIRMWIGNYLKELVLLDLHDNLLTGSIPETLGKLEKLKVLFLNRNTLNGTIPQQLENLTSIESLFLDKNDLKGSLDPVCDAAKKLVFSSADCNKAAPEVTCKCCTMRCKDTDATCNDSKNLDRLNNVASRTHFLFGEDLILKRTANVAN